MFNFQFANDNGTKSAFFLESTLDEIIESNKTQDRLVTLVFNGKEVTEESEIINIIIYKTVDFLWFLVFLGLIFL